MLTLIETMSLAGDRAKQNDDACGAHGGFAWVIDGATDLHAEPVAPWASDASWIAQHLDQHIAAALPGLTPTDASLRGMVRDAARKAGDAVRGYGWPKERWKYPTASMLTIGETSEGLFGLDLGDCRCFALDFEGQGHMLGGRPRAADDETEMARGATAAAGGTPLLRHASTIQLLRDARVKHNQPASYWVFGIEEACADHARAWTLPLKRPAYVLIATDGLSSLVDRYDAYDAGGIVQAALDKGLQELGRELREIEADDAGGTLHPRFKPNDDATGVLLRLT